MDPQSIAIVGASDNPEKIGHVIMQNHIDLGYPGKIYPVNINETGTIMGRKAYKSMLEIKESIDLAIIAVPAQAVPSVLADCGKAHVKGAVVVSGGFAEIGETKLQEELVNISKKYSIPVIGPNCLGVMDPRSKVNTLFLPSFKIDKPKIGGVSFAAQSGAVASSVFDMISSQGFGLARFFSYGNAAVVDESDILNYLMNDKDTKVIVLYIEGAKRGADFIEVARKVTKVKPVVVIKGGITDAGAAAAHSHTAALAGSHEAYDAIFRQFGFTIAHDISELLDFAKVLDKDSQVTGNRIAIITNGGGTGVLATDALYGNGLVSAKLSKESERQLKKTMPPIVNVRLPLDMAGDADEKRFSDALRTVEVDPNVDAIMAIALFQTPGADSKVANMLVNYAADGKKPLVVVSMGGSYTMKQTAIMGAGGVPVYDSPGVAAKALAAMINYSRYKKGVLNV
jgi:acetyl coenzyme A synthetase (ADP forming)-like protein